MKEFFTSRAHTHTQTHSHTQTHTHAHTNTQPHTHTHTELKVCYDALIGEPHHFQASNLFCIEPRPICVEHGCMYG